MGKERLDQSLVNRGLAASREKGKALIMAGRVFVNKVKIDKPGTTVRTEDEVFVKGQAVPFVSRGGLKLEKAWQVFQLELAGKVVMDVGASTGGFTDCALQKGAVRVYAVDVGYGQLDWSLRQDPRVICLERTNARYLTAEEIPEPLDFITVDVAFISLAKILPAILPFLKGGGEILALIKPQFEAGREKVGKKGVVKDPAVHREVIAKIIAISQEMEIDPVGLDFSPITGPEGNIEFLLWMKKRKEPVKKEWEGLINGVVEAAQQALKG